jgi:hypothetical protein
VGLRTWSWGRIALAWAYYWLLLAAIVAAWVWVDLRRLEREYGHADFLSGYAVGGRATVLVLLGPPLALTLAWLWVRHRR